MADRPLPAYDGDEPYIFVTYSHEDTDLVYPQIRWLQDQGFNVGWDEGISPGAVWRSELAQTIRGCSLLLFFTTPNSVASEHCIREVNFALDDVGDVVVEGDDDVVGGAGRAGAGEGAGHEDERGLGIGRLGAGGALLDEIVEGQSRAADVLPQDRLGGERLCPDAAHA